MASISQDFSLFYHLSEACKKSQTFLLKHRYTGWVTDIQMVIWGVEYSFKLHP